MSAKKGYGTEHCATWRSWRRTECSEARSADTDGRGGEGIGRHARTGDWWGEDGENCGEERGEKESGCAPRVEGDERETGVEEACWGGPSAGGKSLSAGGKKGKEDGWKSEEWEECHHQSEKTWRKEAGPSAYKGKRKKNEEGEGKRWIHYASLVFQNTHIWDLIFANMRFTVKCHIYVVNFFKTHIHEI